MKISVIVPIYNRLEHFRALFICLLRQNRQIDELIITDDGSSQQIFDYIADLLKFDDSFLGRTKTTIVTFIPPLLLSLQFPYGFVIAIGYAGLAATIWAAIVPALLVRASRKKFPMADYKVYGGSMMIGFIILFGSLNIIAQVGINLGWLSSFTG